MTNSALLTKSKALALEVIRLCNEVKSTKKETVLTNQLIRSGTSVGANIREAFYAHGKADFIAKLQISLKETAETEYWLRLLVLTEYVSDKEGHSLLADCLEIKRILIATLNTAKHSIK